MKKMSDNLKGGGDFLTHTVYIYTAPQANSNATVGT